MDKDKFKIVYVAPMKALVKEMVDSFGKVCSTESFILFFIILHTSLSYHFITMDSSDND